MQKQWLDYLVEETNPYLGYICPIIVVKTQNTQAGIQENIQNGAQTKRDS